jgi:hypothetical protein
MRLFAAAFACVFVTAGFALAGSSQDLRHRDKNDSKSLLDISSVRGTHHGTTKRLVHTIRTYGRISPRNFRNAIDADGPPGSYCVNIWTTRTPWEQEPNFDVCVSANSKRTALRASVSRHKPGGAIRRVGAAKAVLLNPRRLEIQFNPALIKSPASYRWSVQATSFERGCKRHLGCQDFAPKAGTSVRTRLEVQ